VGWADLEPWDRRARLARVHPRLTEGCLIAAGRGIPELRPEIDAQRSEEDRVRVVLRYFGDEQHPNPDPEHPPKHGPSINGNIAAHDCPPWKGLPPLDDEHSSEGAAGKPAGRPRGSFVETETFWKVWEMALDDNPSARAIEKATNEDPELKYVNREKATVIVNAVAEDRDAARAALDGRKTPPGFSATSDGIRLPNRKPA
jgi:hypothetical protein